MTVRYVEQTAQKLLREHGTRGAGGVCDRALMKWGRDEYRMSRETCVRYIAEWLEIRTRVRKLGATDE